MKQESKAPLFPLAPEMPGSDEIVALETADWGYSVFRQGILSAALIAQANFRGSHPKLPESSSAWGENKIDSSDGPHCMVLPSLRTTGDTGAKIAADEVWQKAEVLPSYP